MLESACPTFPSADFERTKAFYAKLGFHVLGEYPEEGYLLLMRDAVEVHFFRSPEHVAASSHHGAYVRLADARLLSQEFEALALPHEGIPRFMPAEDKPWGMCELAIIDPDGHLLRIGHILPDEA